MNKKLGFVLSDVGPTQLAFDILVNAKAFYAKGWADTDIIAFVDSPSVPIVTPCPIACFPMLELHDYDGVAVATDIQSSAKLLNSIGPAKRFFYVHSLEWVHIQGYQYEALGKIYSNPHLTLIAPTQEYADVIASAWNVEVKVFDLTSDFERFIQYATASK